MFSPNLAEKKIRKNQEFCRKLQKIILKQKQEQYYQAVLIEMSKTHSSPR